MILHLEFWAYNKVALKPSILDAPMLGVRGIDGSSSCRIGSRMIFARNVVVVL